MHLFTSRRAQQMYATLLCSLFELTHRQFLGFRATYHCQQSYQTCGIWRHESSLSRSFILHVTKIAFVIEHDFIMATYLADRVIIFEGQPAISATATS